MKIINIKDFRNKKKKIDPKNAKLRLTINNFKQKLHDQNDQINKINNIINQLNDAIKDLK